MATHMDGQESSGSSIGAHRAVRARLLVCWCLRTLLGMLDECRGCGLAVDHALLMMWLMVWLNKSENRHKYALNNAYSDVSANC